MVKVEIWKDEWYPVFGISVHAEKYRHLDTKEVPAELAERYEKACEEFGAVQKELRRLYENE